MARPLGQVMRAAPEALGCQTNHALATLLGVSLRTVERYSGDPHVGSLDRAPKVVRALYPVNPTLAAELAEALGTNLVALGCVPATREERAAARGNAVATSDELMVVVQALAGVTGLSLEQAREGLAVAVNTALDMGLTLEQLDPVVSTKPPSRR